MTAILLSLKMGYTEILKERKIKMMIPTRLLKIFFISFDFTIEISFLLGEVATEIVGQQLFCSYRYS